MGKDAVRQLVGFIRAMIVGGKEVDR